MTPEPSERQLHSGERTRSATAPPPHEALQDLRLRLSPSKWRRLQIHPEMLTTALHATDESAGDSAHAVKQASKFLVAAPIRFANKFLFENTDPAVDQSVFALDSCELESVAAAP